MELFETEIIKPIENFPNYYITTFGRVWSTYHGGHWLTPTVSKRGNYQRAYVSLGRGNKRYVHQLVAQTFIPNPNNYNEVDHIDRNGINNHVSNLRWVTHEQNMENELTVEVIKKNTGYFVEILDIKTGALYYGYDEASNITGFSKAAIIKHTHNKVKTPRWKLTGKRIRPKN